MLDNATLLERVKNGDTQAEKAMVENNMGLVHSIAKRFTARGAETEDLVQIGAIGLIKAVKKFNPEYGVQFSTYAVPMITGEIKRFMRDDGTVKISRVLKETAMKGWRSEERLRKKLCREPTISEISEECGIGAANLVEAFEAASPPGSIYESVYSGGGKDVRLMDTLGGGEIEEDVINRVLVKEALSCLTEREKKVMLMRYFRGKTQSEIARSLGVSQVQISRIEKKALERIRENMTDD